MKFLKCLVIFWIGIFIWSINFCTAQDLYDFENSSNFAEYLVQTNQYSMAISEYERLVFMDSGNEGLRFKLLTTYIKAGNGGMGITRAEMMYPNPGTMPSDIARVYSYLLFKEKRFQKAECFLKFNRNLPEEDRLSYLGTAKALENNWSEAMFYYDQVSPEQKPMVAQYQMISQNAMNQKKKSPALATGLSVLIPGAGKVYTGDWKDGLIAFIFVGTTAWQANRAFNKSGSNSLRGWIFASISTGFYIGNIFGSHKSAKTYNQKKNELKQKEIENIFYLDF